LANGYKTIPVVYGEKTSKQLFSGLILLTLVPIYLLLQYFDIGHMYIYFYICMVLFLVALIMLWRSTSKTHYLILHNILKFIILVGVFSILLIDIDLVLKRIL